MAEVSVQNNGSSDNTDCIIWLEIRDEGSSVVFEDSLQCGSASSTIIPFYDVPSPQNGEQFTYHFRVETDGDQLAWNDDVYQTVHGEEPYESFELPPVEWHPTEEWAWKYENPLYRPYSGERLMVIRPGGGDSPILRSPKYTGYAGTIMSLRFMNYYELGQDSVTVFVWQDTLLLGRHTMRGTQESYVQESIDFQVDSDKDIYLEWRCARLDSTGSDWYYVLDDVELTVLMDGREADSKPSRLTISGPWPNPSRGSLIWHVVHSGSRSGYVDIYDLTGRRVKRELFRVSGCGTSSFLMDVKSLQPGAYIARFDLRDQSVKRLFVRID